MAVFFTSDHDFGYGGALGLYHRPFVSVADLDQRMIERRNATVAPEDVVYHLGDFAVRQSATRVLSLLRALNGRKHLVVGNSDDDVVVAGVDWDSVQPYLELAVEGSHLVLCHYPFRSWRDMHRGWINLHGHSHARL